ncbi:recombinase family protein, partial [Paracoccus sp. P2]
FEQRLLPLMDHRRAHAVFRGQLRHDAPALRGLRRTRALKPASWFLPFGIVRSPRPWRPEDGGSQLASLSDSRRMAQYELVEIACRRGFRTVDVIDDDLGRSASGMVARPGFEKLVAALCAGEVGAVLCFDASRLARKGRDWHHLLELCGLVEARVIDLDGLSRSLPAERPPAARHEG